MQQYDLFIVIPALFYLGYNMMKSKEKYNGYIGFIFLLTMFIMQDIRTPIFLMLSMIFILFTKKIIFSNKKNLMNF